MAGRRAFVLGLLACVAIAVGMAASAEAGQAGEEVTHKVYFDIEIDGKAAGELLVVGQDQRRSEAEAEAGQHDLQRRALAASCAQPV
jgi:hypothetical protein